MKCRFKYLFALLFIPVLFGCNDIYDDMYNDMKVSLTDHELYVNTSYYWDSIDLPANRYEFNSNDNYIQIDTYGTQTNWKISGVPNWIKLSSTSGTYSEKVTLQISSNISNQERHATLTVTSSDMPGSFEILVTQQRAYINGSGEGTIDYPYDCYAANSYASYLDPNVESEDDIFIRGYVYQIEQQYDEKSGIASFIIADDIYGSNQFSVDGALYLGNKKFASGDTEIKEGDEVVIYGKVINYMGYNPQTAKGKAYLYYLNGSTR
ncbi:MAG: BACON domain-containing protein [Prevotella sp.]|nr:BACON domain-containing protein [Prevotella sp.]